MVLVGFIQERERDPWHNAYGREAWTGGGVVSVERMDTIHCALRDAREL